MIPGSTRALAAALLALLLLASPARAETAVDLQAHPGLGKPARMQMPVPVTCVLTNRGSAVRVRVEARCDPQTGVFAAAAGEVGAAEVDLPEGGRKRLDLLVPRLDGSNRLEVTVRQGKRELARRYVDVEPMWEQNRLLVAVLSPDPTAFAYLASYKGPAGEETTVGRPDPAAFPETGAALAALSLAVVHDLPRLGLSREAQQALADWTRTGGRLVLAPGLDPNEFRGSPLESLLPLRPTGTVSAGGLTLLDGTPDRARALALEDGHPLLLGGERAGGAVAMLTTPLPSTDLLGSRRTEALWTKLLAFAQEARAGFPNIPDDAPLLQRTPELQPPDLALVTWFLLLYVILVGPVNFMILRRRDRMLRIFVTVPVLAGSFALLAFTGGYMVRGGSILLLEVGQLGLRSGEALGRWQGVVGLYSPRADRYSLSLPPGFQVREDMGGSPQPLAVVLDRQVRLQGLEMNMWSMRRFRCAGPVLLDGPLEVRREGRRIVVENRSRLALEDARVAVGPDASEPFNLAAGERREVPAPSTPGEPLADAGSPFEEDRRYLATRFWSEYARDSTPRLMGWASTSLTGVRLEGDRADLRAQTLVVVLGAP